jgi:negative regulator of flagellin synthesis FlgM
MKINDAIKKPVTLDTEKLGTNAGKKTEKSQAGSKAVENVTLSPLSTQLQSLEAKVATDNVFDAEKVDAIKSAIASGQFKVDSEKVADGLIATVKDLLTTKKS